jgi:hypothetical protein
LHDDRVRNGEEDMNFDDVYAAALESESREQAPAGEREAAEQPPDLEEDRIAYEMLEEGRELMARIRCAVRRPAVGALVAGGAVALMAGAWGASEAAVVAVTAYAVYRMLSRKSEASAEAV